MNVGHFARYEADEQHVAMIHQPMAQHVDLIRKRMRPPSAFDRSAGHVRDQARKRAIGLQQDSMLANSSKRAIEVGSYHQILKDGSLVAHSEWDTPSILWKTVVDLHPGRFRADHEMHIGFPLRVGIKCPEPEPQHLGSGVITLVDR